MDQAKEMLEGLTGQGGGMLDAAKNAASGLVGNLDDVRDKAVEIGKKFAPDALDDKVEGMVDTAIDFIQEKFGKGTPDPKK